MSIKVDNVVAHYQSHGKVIIKLDKASGFNRITITKGRDGKNIVGIVPGGKLINYSLAEIRGLLESNRIYIISWGN